LLCKCACCLCALAYRWLEPCRDCARAWCLGEHGSQVPRRNSSGLSCINGGTSVSTGENQKPETSKAELAAAAEWLVIIRSGEASVTEQRAFENWLQSSPSNVAACRSLEQTFLRLPEGLGMGGDAVRDVLLRPSGRRAFMRQAFGFALVAAGGATFFANGRYPLSQLGADVATATGERRDIELPDGAMLRLCARSAVDRYDESIRLRLGALALDGAMRSKYTIEVAGARMEVSGPGRSFATRLESGQAMFGVVDAHAVVVSADGTGQILEPSSERLPNLVIASKNGVLVADRANGGETAWVDGMLEVHEKRLDEVVVGLRRFDHGLIILSDSVRDLRVSGRFSLDRLSDTFAVLAETLPISVRRVPGVVTMIDKA